MSEIPGDKNRAKQPAEIVMPNHAILSIIRVPHGGEIIGESADDTTILDQGTPVESRLARLARSGFSIKEYDGRFDCELSMYIVMPSEANIFQDHEAISSVAGTYTTYKPMDGFAFHKDEDYAIISVPVVNTRYWQTRLVSGFLDFIVWDGDISDLDNSVVFRLDYPVPVVNVLDTLGNEPLSLSAEDFIAETGLSKAHNGEMYKVMELYGRSRTWMKLVEDAIEIGDPDEWEGEDLPSNLSFLCFLLSRNSMLPRSNFANELLEYLRERVSALYKQIVINLKEDIAAGKWREWLQEEEDEEVD